MIAYKTNILTWRLFLASSMKAAIHLGPDLLTNSEIYKNTKFEKNGVYFNTTQKLIKEHSEEILNVECQEYSSPSWTRSILANDQAVKWRKAKVCVYADSVPCVGQVKDISGATERWKGQVGDLKKYFLVPRRSGTRRRTSSQKTSRTGSSSCQCSMTLYGQRMMRIVFRMPKSQELRDGVLTRTLDVSGSRIGREVVGDSH